MTPSAAVGAEGTLVVDQPAWQQPVTLSESDDGLYTGPGLAVDDAGNAVVAASIFDATLGWIDHYHGTVHVSRWNGSAWGAADTIGRGTAFSSIREVLGLDVGSGSVAAAVWKSTVKGGARTMAASYNK